jgi:dUTP pyrophosphatase
MKADLYIYVDQSVKNEYSAHVKSHNEKILASPYPDSGFDLLTLNNYIVPSLNSVFVSMGIKCAMYFDGKPSGFYLYPRSSISKTPLLMANHVGIIDSGYRGWVIGAFRNLGISQEPYTYNIEKNTRLTQICHPSLCPITVHIVDTEEELGITARGEGGFGSTGK